MSHKSHSFEQSTQAILDLCRAAKGFKILHHEPLVVVKMVSPRYVLMGTSPHFSFLPWVTDVHVAQTVWDMVFLNVPKLNLILL